MLSVVVGCSISFTHAFLEDDPYLVVEQGNCAFDILHHRHSGFAVDSTRIEVVACIVLAVFGEEGTIVH